MEDRIELLRPAWRQNGTLIEQGYILGADRRLYSGQPSEQRSLATNPNLILVAAVS